MALTTYSSFLYGYTIGPENYLIAFDEGSGEVIAEVDQGSYSFVQLARAVARALNNAGDNTYSVSVDRENRYFTVTCTTPFDWLGASTNALGNSALPTLGIPLTDSLATTSVSSTSTTGILWEPQFILQEYSDHNKNQTSAFANVNKSASGNVQIQNFGLEKFAKFNAKFITNIEQPSGGPFLDDQNGVENCEAFLQFIINKSPFEFHPDKNTVDEYNVFIVESTTAKTDGTGYELRELYDRGLSNYYETGTIKLRLIE